jgi:hypothetical protein
LRLGGILLLTTSYQSIHCYDLRKLWLACQEV